MTTKNNHKNEPLVMRLMLATIFLPVALVVIAVMWGSYVEVGDPEFFESRETVFGISADLLVIVSLIVIPMLCPLVVLWKGCWRAVLIVLAIVLLFYIIFGIGEFSRVAPEDRWIDLTRGIPEGADVYCNDVLLGQTPMKIRVGDLKAKVPAWTTPPDQADYRYAVNPVYAYLPWDRFERDRYEEYRALNLEDKKAVQKYDAASKYWWKIERKGMSYHFAIMPRGYVYDQNNRFDHLQAYSPMTNSVVVTSHSQGALQDVVILSYDQLNEKEKEVWSEYLCSLPTEFYSEMGERIDWLTGGKNSSDKGREMLERIARKKYRFAENPDSAECRRILETVIAENKKTGSLQFGIETLAFGCTLTSSSSPGTLASYALGQLGTPATEPTRELLSRYWYGSSNAMVPAVMVAENLKSPELFEDQVRFYATSSNTLASVFENRDERVLPLFRTMMNSMPLLSRFSKESEISGKISALTYILDDRMQPYIRDEIASITADEYYITGYQWDLQNFISVRIRRNKDNKEQREEWLKWLDSLRINPQVKAEVKNNANTIIVGSHVEYQGFLRMTGLQTSVSVTAHGDLSLVKPNTIISFKNDNEDEDEEIVQLTTTDLCKWLEENPEQEIADYFREYAPNMPKDVDVVRMSLEKLVFDNSPEAGKILKQYWNDSEKKELLLQTLRSNFSRWLTMKDAIDRDRDQIGMYLAQHPVEYAWMVEFKNLNPVMMEIFNEIEDAELCMIFIHIVSGKYKPGVVELLEKWSESDDEKLRVNALVELDAARKLAAIHTQSRELLLRLAAGKMTPDDLMPKPQAWTWQDGKYVKKTGE